MDLGKGVNKTNILIRELTTSIHTPYTYIRDYKKKAYITAIWRPTINFYKQ